MFYILIIILCIMLAFLGLGLVFKWVNPSNKHWKTRFKIHCYLAIGIYLIASALWAQHIIDQININQETAINVIDYLTSEWGYLHLIGLIIIFLSLVFDYKWLKPN